MFIEFLTQKEFYKTYMQLFSIRSSIGNLEMEDSSTELTDPKRAIELYNNLNAFMSIIDENPDEISPYDVINIADRVNKNLGFYDKGYRKTQVDVKKAKNFFPIDAKLIPSKIYSLFDNYRNIWCDLPIYEKEALLHIELVRLQPFEDGNKRTSRILTNFNLCKQNKAPIVLNNSETNRYFSYIDNYDIEGMTELFEKKSKEELEVMINLYRNICGDEILPSYNAVSDNNDVNIISLVNENILSTDSSPDDLKKLDLKFKI